MTPASCSPSVWGEAGTETITFSFEGTDVTCEVEGTSLGPELRSLTYTGSLTNDQFVGSAPDLTGLTFTAHYSDSTLDQEVTPTSVLPATYDEAGSATVTASYTDEYGTASNELSVSVIEAVLDHLTITGDFTNLQYRGSAPDLTGLTVKAVYTDGNEETLTSSDYEVSPAVWPQGNPDNLAQARVTVSYTEDEVTKTAYKQPTLHYPTEQTLVTSSAGHVYFDFDPEWRNSPHRSSNNLYGLDAYFSNDCHEGDIVALPFLKSTYDADTYETPTELGPYIMDFGGLQDVETGTINTPGYVPSWDARLHWDGTDIIPDECYVAASIKGNASAQETVDCVYVVGKLNRVDTINGYKKTDLDLTDQSGFQGAVYTIHFVPSLP